RTAAMPESRVAAAPDRVRRDSFRVSCSAIDEIAVERELPNERIDLAQRQRHGWSAFEIATDEAIRGHAEIDSRLGGVFDGGGTVFACEGEHAEDAADTGRTVVPVDVIADGTDRQAGLMGSAEQGQRFRGRATGAIGILDATPSAGARRCSRSSCPVV